MPFSHWMSEAEGIAYVVADPPVDLESIRKSIADLAGDPGFRPQYKVLVDLRKMKFSPANDEIQSIASAIQERKDKYRNRIGVVVDNDLHFGLMRIISSRVEMAGIRMDVFRDLDTAKAWLLG